ncbi:MAG TPA: 50S ribosomal protein L11 methyltransferase [Gemmatimonadaceae bacterium]|nr:50S ribosomal protein L11 methyltransferase [Gemmatimonadaceae bacterium]
MTSWVTVRVAPGERRDDVMAALFEAGAQGVQELDDALITHVPDQDIANAIVCAVLAVGDDVRVETEPLPEVDWSEQWKRGIRAQELGGLAIVPPWLAEGRDPARTVVIEPAMAFGTGEHATTRGVVRLMQRVLRGGEHVADLGAGSAVLSIAAIKLGAANAAAIEIDPDAIGNGEENVRRNGVEDRVRVIQGDAATLLPLVAPVHLVLANIISSVLTELLPAISLALTDDGRAILSGILLTERAEMLRTLSQSGWRIVDEDSEDAWWSATIDHR